MKDLGRFVVHTGLLVAAIATLLAAASAATLGGALGWAASITIFAGTLAVYAFDRRIDDHVDRPHRESFDRRHRRLLTVTSVAAVALAAGAALRLPPEALGVLAATGLLALAHPRWRDVAWFKPLYIAVAWLAVVVALPAILLERTATAATAELAPVGLAILANVVACDAADREAEARRLGARRTWWVARALAGIGIVVALVGPAPTRVLALVPAGIGLALVPYRPHPDAKPWLDAALGAGAAAAWMAATAL